MKTKNYLLNYLWYLIVLLLGVVLIFWVAPLMARNIETKRSDSQVGYDSSTVRALVLEILDQGQVTLGETAQHYQDFSVRVLEGQYQNQIMTVDYGKQQIRPSAADVHPGEEVLISIGQRPDGSLLPVFIDFMRIQPILQLFFVFVLTCVLIGGWKGFRGLLGILLSMAIILFFIVPQILAGHSPVWSSIIGSFVFLAISLYLVYGWNLKTHSAVLSMLLALILSGLLSALFINATRLTGTGDENSLYLTQMAQTSIDLRGLLLGGMIIGALGVLDDLVISQASAVFELHGANPDLTIGFLFRRAMNIGRDHVAATVNTLVLAYTGASLPMLLLFSLNNQNFGLLINLDYLAEEIVRALVGSIGLFAAVPIATGLAVLAAKKSDKLGRLLTVLGPENSSEGHAHSH